MALPTSSKKPPASARKKADDMSSAKVRVGVRVRPIATKEQDVGSTNVLEATDRSIQLSLPGRDLTYWYDDVFDCNVSQADLYEQVSPPLLQSFLDGYNATVRILLSYIHLKNA
jgi:Kinesin motor domain